MTPDIDTKKKIVDAAYKVLGEQGYDKASMKEIAKEAGVAQGLINYYFKSKEDLLFELFKMESNRYCGNLEKLKDIPMSESFVKDALDVPKEMVISHPEWHRLRYELFAIGLRTEHGRKEIKKFMDDSRELVMNVMERLPLGDGVDRKSLASIVVPMMDGFALQQMADPDFDYDAAYDTLANMIETYFWSKM